MFKHAKGFIFEARKDATGKMGIIERYKTFDHITELIFGVTQKGKISTAVYCDKHEGFTQLKELLGNDCTDEQIDKFLSSRRALYGVIGNIVFICRARIKEETGELLSIDLYIPMSENVLNDGKPCIICNKVNTKKGIHHYIMAENLYNDYIEKVKKELFSINIGSKRDYYRYRMYTK